MVKMNLFKQNYIHNIAQKEIFKKELTDKGIKLSPCQLNISFEFQSRLNEEVEFEKDNITDQETLNNMIFECAIRAALKMMKEYRAKGDWESFGAIHFLMGASHFPHDRF